MKNEFWQGLRYILIAAGTYLATSGKLPVTVEEIGPIADSIVHAVGAVITVGTMVWGLYVRWRTASVPDTAAKRADVPIVSTATGKLEKKP